jgi:hypothetical protein
MERKMDLEAKKHRAKYPEVAKNRAANANYEVTYATFQY